MRDIAIEIPKGPLSVDEFVEWVMSLPKEAGRFELLDGAVVRMQSERVGHARTKREIGIQFDAQIRAKALDCEYLPAGIGVRLQENWFEPDGVVVCGAPPADDQVGVDNPTIVVEVLSPSNSRVESVAKIQRYFDETGVEHVLFVDAGRRRATHFRRRDGNPNHQIAGIAPGGSILLDPPGLTLDLDRVFAVTRSADAPSDPSDDKGK